MRLIDADALIEFCAERWIPLNIDAVNMQPTIQQEKAQLSKEGTTSDTISRTEVVEHLRRVLEATVPNTDYDEGYIDGIEFGISTVSTMPTIQPQSTTGQLNDGVRSTAQSTDLIDRRAAIDALDCINGTEEVLRSLPPAQPSQDKYEYHYDHTDCIWYRPEARNRCPTTCAQYRDGWNDAMNYIFRDGEGYRPFRRDKKYEG